MQPTQSIAHEHISSVRRISRRLVRISRRRSRDLRISHLRRQTLTILQRPLSRGLLLHDDGCLLGIAFLPSAREPPPEEDEGNLCERWSVSYD